MKATKSSLAMIEYPASHHEHRRRWPERQKYRRPHIPHGSSDLIQMRQTFRRVTIVVSPVAAEVCRWISFLRNRSRSCKAVRGTNYHRRRHGQLSPQRTFRLATSHTRTRECLAEIAGEPFLKGH